MDKIKVAIIHDIKDYEVLEKFILSTLPETIDDPSLLEILYDKRDDLAYKFAKNMDCGCVSFDNNFGLFNKLDMIKEIHKNENNYVAAYLDTQEQVYNLLNELVYISGFKLIMEGDLIKNENVK